MDENETPHPDYIKGFNEGYLMAKRMPELSEQLAKSVGASSRSKGFNDGRQELILEQTRDRLPGWLQSDKFSALDDFKPDQKEKNIDEPEL